MTFQTKTLIALIPATVLLVAFQNCAPQKFAQVSSASEKTLSADGTSPTIDPAAQPVIDVPANQPAPSSDSGAKSCDLPKNDGEKRAAKCKELRAKFVAMKVAPANPNQIHVSGLSQAGPYFVSGVNEIVSTGASDVYVVGSDANAMAKSVRSSGFGHVVLCGLYAGDVRASGGGIVDVIGANVLGETSLNGSGLVRVFDQDGQPL